jgi:hypothetical protein
MEPRDPDKRWGSLSKSAPAGQAATIGSSPIGRSGRIGAVDREFQELLDREAIGETISRLFIATDRRDWQAVGNRELESSRKD